MLTREQILEIDHYCDEHKMTQSSYLEEHKIPRHQYYTWKRKYREKDQCENAVGTFVQLPQSGVFVSSAMPPARTSGKPREPKQSSSGESYLTVELRTPTGTAMRIQGNMTAVHLREIISASNVQS